MAKKGKKKRSKRSGRRPKPKPEFRGQVETELVDRLLYRFVALVKHGLELMLRNPSELTRKEFRKNPELVHDGVNPSSVYARQGSPDPDLARREPAMKRPKTTKNAAPDGDLTIPLEQITVWGFLPYPSLSNFMHNFVDLFQGQWVSFRSFGDNISYRRRCNAF